MPFQPGGGHYRGGAAGWVGGDLGDHRATRSGGLRPGVDARGLVAGGAHRRDAAHAVACRPIDLRVLPPDAAGPAPRQQPYNAPPRRAVGRGKRGRPVVRRLSIDAQSSGSTGDFGDHVIPVEPRGGHNRGSAGGRSHRRAAAASPETHRGIANGPRGRAAGRRRGGCLGHSPGNCTNPWRGNEPDGRSGCLGSGTGDCTHSWSGNGPDGHAAGRRHGGSLRRGTCGCIHH
mmetsp:Transcript_10959/g.31185  ORF Transcript_10959/g.31185 Transcript_10959/m.31185 type:complete len:231 (+) Transcript_10959:311-1003(+)